MAHNTVERAGEEPPSRRSPMKISKTWAQAVALVMIFGFFVLGFLAYRTYSIRCPNR
ncbi:hypothetical protein GS425_20160, partial [Rhodococcus hoagii]|nr:hypothetical protein [Prescottella equi]